MHRRLIAPLTASFAVAALALAACGSDSPSSSSATTAAAGAATTATGATTAPATTAGGYEDPYGSPATTAAPVAGAGATVGVAETSLGPVLVDGDGLTLYLFTNDSPNTTTCTGDCLVAWPALTATEAPTAGTGVDASKLGTITRPDGATQVTYAGWPLYGYARDAAAGDVTGQGVGGVWFAVQASGQPAAG